MALIGVRASRPLIKAIGHNDLSLVVQLIGEEKDLNFYDQNNDLLGTDLAYDTDTALEYAISTQSLKIVELLLDADADVNFQGKFQRTPIMAAIKFGTKEICELLIARGADPRVCDYFGENAFDICGIRGSWLSSYVSPEQKAEMAAEQAALERARSRIQFTDNINGKLVQETYCFDTRECVTFVREDENAPVEAILREPFANIQTRPNLKVAFDQHVSLGGALTHADVFVGASIQAIPSLKDGFGKHANLGDASTHANIFVQKDTKVKQAESAAHNNRAVNSNGSAKYKK